MAGKLTVILAKKEAEAYNAQGLHNEAMSIYKDLLASASGVENKIKDSIQRRMEQIEAKVSEIPDQESQRLSFSDIMRIRKGWGSQATEDDLLVCANALCQVGHYRYALKEIAALIHKGCAPSKVMGVLADCLIHLYKPQSLIRVFDKLAQRLTGPSKTPLDMQLMVGLEMTKRKAAQHAAAVWRHLKNKPEAQQTAPGRLAALADEVQKLQTREKAEGPKQFRPPPPPPPDETKDSGTGRLYAVMRKYLKFSRK